MVDIRKLDEIMTLTEKIHGLTTRGLLSFEERDALVGVMKNEVRNVLVEAAKEEESKAKEAEKVAKAQEKKAGKK